MANKWVIKRYKEIDIKVSEKVGRQALAAWEAGVAVIKLPGDISMAGSSISAIEPTFETDDFMKEITSGIDEKSEVILDLEGNVVTNWYKKNVSIHEWEKKYSALPNYYKLVGDDRSVWVAMRLPEVTGVNWRSPELVICDENEIRTLNGFT